MRHWWLIIPFLFSAVSAFAQEAAEDYYIYKLEREEFPSLAISTDTLLFYRAIQLRDDLYDDLSSYRFSFTRHARRGYDFTRRRVEVDGLGLRSENEALLRRLGLTRYSSAGIDHSFMGVGDVAGVDVYLTTEGVPVNSGDAAFFFSGRGYLGGVRTTVNRLMAKGWSMSLHVAARGGDDLYVRGVYQNSVDAGVRLTKSYDSGAEFSVIALSRVGERGLRRGSTEEAYSLVGNNMYNPAWGRHGDKVRNSRYRRDAVPFAMLSAKMMLGDATVMRLAVGGDYGHRAYSMLGWYDAMTPYPDNYRYMPSYYADDDIAEAVAHEWRAGNESVMQVDWADMYAQNSRSSRGAIYALEERIERVARGEAMVRFSTEFGQQLSLDYGLRGKIKSLRRYKQMADLLGAEYMLDVDYYLMDDDTYSNNLQNDLRHPNRHIVEGDRFAYDYAMVERSLMADASLKYHAARWRVGVDVAIGRDALHRVGYFEKELFPGARSYGKSRSVTFSPYKLKAMAGYAFSAASYLDFGLSLDAAPPGGDVLFLNPTYNNRLVEAARLERTISAEVNYKYRSSNLDVALSAYLHSTRNGRDMMRCYDDLSAVYCDVEVEDVAVLRYGVEMAAMMRLSEHFRAEATLGCGRYIYSENPYVTHYSDTDNSVICARSESLMKGLHLGGAPCLMSSVGLTYLSYRGWIASCGVNYAGFRYVEPSFVRRTERVLRQGSISPETYALLLHQRRLGDAVTVDASLSRWFRVGESRLSLTLSCKNLLDNRDVIYGGYEPSRVRHYKSGANRVYAPQDDVVTYAYPRTFYAVVSWKF